MCGIAGLIHRGKSSDVGHQLQGMLQALKHRGPDSTGYALYADNNTGNFVMRFKVGENVKEGSSSVNEDISVYDARKKLVDQHLADLGTKVIKEERLTPYSFRYEIKHDGDLMEFSKKIESVEMVEILSIGKSLELVKDIGDAGVVSERYGLHKIKGTHGIGHTRMATESGVDIKSAHPFWGYPFSDVSVVHNGQLTNYWNNRRALENKGMRFMSECDSELIAVYLANKMRSGATLEEGMRDSLRELDGVFTYFVATKDSLGMAKDTMAAKPLVLYESDDLVAMGSEEIAIRSVLPQEIDTYDPYDGEVKSMANLKTAEKKTKAQSMGLHTETLTGRTQQKFFNPDEAENFYYFGAYDVDFNKRTELDVKDLDCKQANQKIDELMSQGYGTIVIKNPQGKHSLGVGVLNKLNLIFEGSLGYFGVGSIDGPMVRINGRVGWSCAENMMAGKVVIEKNAGSCFGAAIRGGDLICKGSVGARTGIDMKGGTIIIGGDAGAFTGFMMQRGRIIILGNVGINLGDSMYDGTIYIGGKIGSFGSDAVESPLTKNDIDWLKRKLKVAEIGENFDVTKMTKVVAGKKLWNYDALEPTEKKGAI